MKRLFCFLMMVYCLLMCGSAVDETTEATQPVTQEEAFVEDELLSEESVDSAASEDETMQDLNNAESESVMVEELQRIQVIVPNKADFYAGRTYSAVVAEFLDAGFTSVQVDSNNEVKVNSQYSNGDVISVSVAGNSNFHAGQAFDVDAEVVVHYFQQTKANMPFSADRVENEQCQTLLKKMYEAGFTNITVEEAYDLDPVAYSGKSTAVMTVNEKTTFNVNDEFAVDVPVKIKMHYPKDQYAIKVNIDFLTNLFFNKYSIKVSFDGEAPVVLSHGEDKTLAYRRPAGTYTLKFESASDSALTGTMAISVSGDTEASCDISCNSDCVEVEAEVINTINSKSENEIVLFHSVNYYLRRNQSDCVRLLKELGFTNIKIQAVTDTVWGSTKPEQVTSVAIAGNREFAHGDIYPKNAEVVVSYHIPKVEFIKTDFSVTEDDPLTIPYFVAEGDSLADITLKVENKEFLKHDTAYSFTALTPGETVVSAYYKDICLAQCNVTVELRIIPIAAITILEPERNIVVGSTFQVDYVFEPKDANYTDVIYTFSDPILEQLENGMIYSNAAGEATIAVSQDGRNLGTVSIHAEEVPVEQIVVSDEKLSVGAGRVQEMTFSLLPEKATCIGLQVTSSNPKIATVEFNEKGAPVIQITGVKVGNATITIKASNKIIAKKQITVTEVIPESLEIQTDAEQVYIGSTGVLTVAFNPADTTNQKVTWKSSAPKVIKVNNDGSYQALSVGEATITATHAKGVSNTIQMQVLPVEVKSLDLITNWDNTKPFYKNNTMTLTAKISPENATDKSIVWASSDEAVATVSNKGVVKAVAPGNCTITATASNGMRRTYKVTVDVSPQKFRVSATISMKSNNSVGGSWTKGFEVNGETIYSGGTVSIMPGEYFSVRGWAEENDSNPDYGSFGERMELTSDMCSRSFTIEGEFNVRENGGRYRGNIAVWTVKFTFTPIN